MTHALVLHLVDGVEHSWRCSRCGWHLRTCTPGDEPGAAARLWSPDGIHWWRREQPCVR